MPCPPPPARPSALVASLALVLAAAVALAAARPEAAGPASPATTLAPGDPAAAAALALEGARASRLLVQVRVDGVVVATAVVDTAGAADVSALGLTGRQSGGRLLVDGAALEVPAIDRAALLAPLRRPARWAGAALVLEGAPPATATLAPSGDLAELVVDLGAGAALEVAPAP